MHLPELQASAPDAPLRVHGLDVSYFTGKLEAALRAKGLPYVLVEMDTRSLRASAKRTGVAQMPQLELPDARWLTDTTPILQWLERAFPVPALAPQDPALNFVACLLEDFGDEWLWRPAMYYRWAFAPDAQRVRDRLARGLLRDVPLPLALRRWLIQARQRHLFLKRDGVTQATAPVVTQMYPDVLAAMEVALAAQPYLLGARPTQADFGFFGSMFRHFASDPTPAALMRAQAPRVAQWVQRLWTLQPQDFADAMPSATAPVGLGPLLALVCDDYFVYLRANAAAWDARAIDVRWTCRGVAFTTPVNPYRVWCLQELCDAYRALHAPDRENVNAWIAASGAIHSAATLQLLSAPRSAQRPAPVPPWQADADQPRSPPRRPRNRHWQ